MMRKIDQVIKQIFWRNNEDRIGDIAIEIKDSIFDGIDKIDETGFW